MGLKEMGVQYTVLVVNKRVSTISGTVPGTVENVVDILLMNTVCHTRGTITISNSVERRVSTVCLVRSFNIQRRIELKESIRIILFRYKYKYKYCIHSHNKVFIKTHSVHLVRVPY